MRSFCLVVCLLLIGVNPASAQEDLQRWIPPHSNAVAIVRVGELLNSQIGRRSRWLEEHRDAYAAGLVSAPPSVLEMMRATEYRPYSAGKMPVYSVHSMRVDVSMRDIARHELSQTEQFGDTFAVRSSRGVYFARLGPRTLGALQPADRQLLSRWLKFGAANTKSQLSEYVRETLTAEKGAQVVIALDLSDMTDADYLAQWLTASPTVMSQSGDVGQLAEQFASIRGLRLSVGVTNQIVGKLQLDFAQPVTASVDVMKGIVLEWLDEAGARIDTLAAADASVKDKSFVLTTQLEEPGLRRILSMIQTQHPAEAGDRSAEVPAANAIASLRYYRGVVAAVNDLSSQTRRAAIYEKTALWHENHAVRIENLSTVGVDSELAAWGYNVAQQLRALAGSLRGVPVEVDRLERKIRVDTRVFNRRIATTEFGGIFRPEWFTAESNLEDVRAAQQETIIQDQADRDHIWTMLEEDRLAIVSKMQSNFNLDFDKK